MKTKRKSQNFHKSSENHRFHNGFIAFEHSKQYCDSNAISWMNEHSSNILSKGIFKFSHLHYIIAFIILLCKDVYCDQGKSKNFF